MLKKTFKLTMLLLCVLAVSFIFDWKAEVKEEATPLPEEKVEAPFKDGEGVVETDLPQVSIIIDDLGNNFSVDRTIENIDVNLTLAVLPFQENTKKSANFFKEKQEVILHLPLEPISEDQKEEEMITTSMNREEIKKFLDKALEEFDAVGINNHKGSLFTASEDSVRMLLREVGDLFFVYSFTIGSSKVYTLAKEMGIKTAKRDIFLDNSRDREDIKNKLYEVVLLAEEEGSAIAIGHSFKETISVLREEAPKLKDRVSFVYVSDILK